MASSKDPMKYPNWMLTVLMEDRGNKELFRITLPRREAVALRARFYAFLSAITASSGFTELHGRARELTTRLDYHPDDSVTLVVVDRDLAIDPRIEAALADMIARRPANSTPIIPHHTQAVAIPTSINQFPTQALKALGEPAQPEPEPPVEPPAKPLETLKPIRTEVERKMDYPQEHCYRFDLITLIEHTPAGAIPYWFIDMWKDEHPDLSPDKPTFMKNFHEQFKNGELAKWWDSKRVLLQAKLNEGNS